MKRIMKRNLCIRKWLSVCLAVLLLGGTLSVLPVLPVSAAQVVTIRGNGLTTIYVSEVYSELFPKNPNGTHLYNDTAQCDDPYFENLRAGDAFTVQINVLKTGDYHFCFSFGWIDARGDYTVQIDNEEPVRLRNTVSGIDWRIWMDSSDAKIHLTEGEHTMRVTVNCDGPNIRAMKIAPVGEDFEASIETSDSDLFEVGEPVDYDMEADDRFGVQFKTDVPIDGAEVYISAVAATSNTLTLTLYEWKDDYHATVKSAPVAQETLKNLKVDDWARLSHRIEAGEYLLEVTDGTSGMKVSVVEERTENVNHYWHASASGVSLVCRLVGTKKLSPPTAPSEPDFISDDAFLWEATDGLGRTLPTQNETGGVREDKYVGIFYHTWHASHALYGIPANVTNLLKEHPDAIHDYNHTAWRGYNIYFWNEPIWGYYNNGIDRYVLRKQAELLADAGVDVVFFDNTNGTENYISAIMTLCEVWAEARADGVKTPQISCMLNMFAYGDTAKQLIELYDKIYSKGLYQDLWFYWDGKPLMMGYPEELLGMGRQDVYDFFSYRVTNPSYTTAQDQILPHDGVDGVRFTPPSGFSRYTQWKWISVYPQQKMMNRQTRKVEEMCVCVAQNWSAYKGLTAMNAGDMVFGRGYTDANGINTSDEAVMHGLNFAEQWEYALQVDPTFIYITGWNEWVAGRYETSWGDPNALPDNATDGYSRDIEPSTGMLKDHFYNQMVSYIREFKGIPAQTPSSGAIDDPENIDWSAVTPVFRTYKDNTLERDVDGYPGYHYENTTGRNDFVESRVTYDSENIYFMVKTAETITPHTDKAWMRLLIDVVGVENDQNWETFEYILNRESPTADQATLERSTGGWNWEIAGTVDYKVDGDTMVVTIPRAALGIGEGVFTVNFKWSDNMQVDGDIMDFYTNGDVAPGARYKYSFTSLDAEENESEAETSVESDTTPVPETPASTEPDTSPISETPALTEAETDALTNIDTTAETGTPKKGGCSSLLGFSVLIILIATGIVFSMRKDRSVR